MTRGIQTILRFTTRVMKHEMSGKGSSATTAPGAVPAWEKLRPQVVVLMGNGGFRALLTRALALAQTDVPWLRAAHVNAAGMLDGMDKPGMRVARGQEIEGSSVLLAHLIGLLVTFIGAALTLNMVREVWPKISVNDSDFFIEGPHDDAK